MQSKIRFSSPVRAAAVETLERRQLFATIPLGEIGLGHRAEYATPHGTNSYTFSLDKPATLDIALSNGTASIKRNGVVMSSGEKFSRPLASGNYSIDIDARGGSSLLVKTSTFSPPTRLEAQALGGNAGRLNWNDNTDAEVSYRVDRWTRLGWRRGPRTGADATAVLLPNLVPGFTTTYRVSAVTADGESLRSANTVSMTTSSQSTEAWYRVELTSSATKGEAGWSMYDDTLEQLSGDRDMEDGATWVYAGDWRAAVYAAIASVDGPVKVKKSDGAIVEHAFPTGGDFRVGFGSELEAIEGASVDFDDDGKYIVLEDSYGEVDRDYEDFYWTVTADPYVELAWNTDDNGPLVSGMLIALDGSGDAYSLPDSKVVGPFGGAGISVDWGDSYAPDDGTLLHWFPGEGTYSITLSSPDAYEATWDVDVADTSNPFDPIAGPDASASSEYGYDESFGYVGDSEETTSTSLAVMGLMAQSNTAPPLIRSRLEAWPPEEEANWIDRAKQDARAEVESVYAQVYVGIYDADLLHSAKVPLHFDPRSGKMVDTVYPGWRRTSLIKGVAKVRDSIYAGKGDHGAAVQTVNAIANDQRAPVSDDGNGHVYTQLQDGTELDLHKDGTFGRLFVKHGNVQVEVWFGSRFKEVVVVDAAGNDITDIDRLDGPYFSDFVEEKDATGLLKVPQAKQAAAVADWVDKQIKQKAAKYLQIPTGATTRKGPGYEGMNNPPPINFVKTVRSLKFEIKAASKQVPGLEAAVHDAIVQLRLGPSGWSFNVDYVP